MATRSHDYEKKLYRLVKILNKLETESKVSPRDLAREFNVSLRTVQRDIELLDKAEFPIVSVVKGRYTFMPGFSLKRLPLSGEEASLLAFLCEVAGVMGGDFEKSFRSLHAKLIHSADGESPFHALQPILPKRGYPAMAPLRKAISGCRKVEIEYSNGKRHRLCPLKIIHAEGFWYLLGQISGFNDRTVFRLDRIKDVVLQDDIFKPPKRLAKLLARRTSIWFGDSSPIRVTLRIDEEVKDYFRNAAFFPEQKIVRERRDGSLEVQARISHFMEVIPMILKWLPHIRVLRPQRLRDEIRRVVRRYLKSS